MDLAEGRARATAEGTRHPWEQARLDIVNRLLTRHAHLVPGAVVLDVGCGDTFVVERLARANPDVTFYAIDTAFTDDLIARYRTAMGVTNVHLLRDLAEVPEELSGPVAAVLLMDVIEHIDDDRGFLRTLCGRSWFDAGTTALITVPAYQALFCSHDTFLGHYRRYSNRLLRARAMEAGLGVVDMGYFFLSLLPIRLLQAARERLLPSPSAPTTGLVTWQGGPLKTAVAKRCLALDAALSFAARRCGVTLPGLSNYAICRKSA
jgi:hypothetical protein